MREAENLPYFLLMDERIKIYIGPLEIIEEAHYSFYQTHWKTGERIEYTIKPKDPYEYLTYLSQYKTLLGMLKIYVGNIEFVLNENGEMIIKKTIIERFTHPKVERIIYQMLRNVIFHRRYIPERIKQPRTFFELIYKKYLGLRSYIENLKFEFIEYNDFLRSLKDHSELLLLFFVIFSITVEGWKKKAKIFLQEMERREKESRTSIQDWLSDYMPETELDGDSTERGKLVYQGSPI